MLIINQNQITKCQFKITNQDEFSQGFIDLKDLFMEIGLNKIKPLKEAINYEKTLLDQDELCLILDESNSYNIWCLVPEPPVEVKT